MACFKYQPTPNPDSFKITRSEGSFIATGLLAISNLEEAKSHPLALALFYLEGISNILILPDFLTVTKDSQIDWRALWKDVESTLETFYDENTS